ncbi:hypothetical protein Pla22_41260 [Rubripirellula amarantea]|uniref:Uncharacterized protein n=1 Tax=Rubripirellula amarantea TaxID=2527999 RepID=A0A5C5WMN4_9BACT|nr:hypothetical protein Pla22_41260 [Rubripirellula amarantea]
MHRQYVRHHRTSPRVRSGSLLAVSESTPGNSSQLESNHAFNVMVDAAESQPRNTYQSRLRLKTSQSDCSLQECQLRNRYQRINGTGVWRSKSNTLAIVCFRVKSFDFAFGPNDCDFLAATVSHLVASSRKHWTDAVFAQPQQTTDFAVRFAF